MLTLSMQNPNSQPFSRTISHQYIHYYSTQPFYITNALMSKPFETFLGILEAILRHYLAKCEFWKLKFKKNFRLSPFSLLINPVQIVYPTRAII